MAHPLPERLRYLRPVQKQLAALAPDEIHEETDLSLLRRAVQKRIKGLSEEEALSILREDAEELERWLTGNDLSDSPLYYVLPILPDALEILLSKPPQALPERGEVSMELPEGAKMKSDNGCWTVKWRRLHFDIYLPIPKTCTAKPGE
jgi:hypothetical protein